MEKKLNMGHIGFEISEIYPEINILGVVDCESKAGIDKLFKINLYFYYRIITL